MLVLLLTSLSAYIGQKTFVASWTSWYYLRPFIGALIALLFYLVIRGGFYQGTVDTNDLYVIVALAGLAGMFSRKVTTKLSDITDALFGKETTTDTLIRLVPSPVITDIGPQPVAAGANNVTLTVTGKNFVKESEIQTDGKGQTTTTFVSATQLTVLLPDSDVAMPGILAMKVVNPDDKGGASESVDVTIK